MSIKTTVQTILGRNLLPQEGIDIDDIYKVEKTLNCKIPNTLVDYYTQIGKIELFTNGFNQFVAPEELLILDNKLVFLEENQGVLYWAIDLDENTVYQTSDLNVNTTWYKEDFKLPSFLEMMLYFQCLFADQSYHQKVQGGFDYFASLAIDLKYKSNYKAQDFIKKVTSEWNNVSSINHISIHQKNNHLLCYFLNQENKIHEMILVCTKSETFLDKLIDEYQFGEL